MPKGAVHVDPDSFATALARPCPRNDCCKVIKRPRVHVPCLRRDTNRRAKCWHTGDPSLPPKGTVGQCNAAVCTCTQAWGRRGSADVTGLQGHDGRCAWWRASFNGTRTDGALPVGRENGDMLAPPTSPCTPAARHGTAWQGLSS